MTFVLVFACCVAAQMHVSQAAHAQQQQIDALNRIAAINAGAARQFYDPITKSSLNEMLIRWRTILDPAKRATVTLKQLNQAVRDYIRMRGAVIVADDNKMRPLPEFERWQITKNEWLAKIRELFPLEGDDAVATHFMLYLQPSTVHIERLQDTFVNKYFDVGNSANEDIAFDKKRQVIVQVRDILKRKGFVGVLPDIPYVYIYYQEPYMDKKIAGLQEQDRQQMEKEALQYNALALKQAPS